MTHCEAQYSCLPLPGLHQHLASCGVPSTYEKWPEGGGARGAASGRGGAWAGADIDQECAMDPALAELRQHLLRHKITFVVFDMDLTVTARHTRGHLARDPDTMALYLESARVTDALKVCCEMVFVVTGVFSCQSLFDGELLCCTFDTLTWLHCIRIESAA